MGHQCLNADDRVLDVLGELVAQLRSNFLIALANMAVRGGEAFQVGDRLNIPNDHIAHGAFNREALQSPFPAACPSWQSSMADTTPATVLAVFGDLCAAAKS
jgi:hypothetical protein